uniref:TRP_2 domain-containing protein n=1 Tax=Brugia malayi TaxID=6279 RepID=A0A8L7T789_BRUMA
MKEVNAAAMNHCLDEVPNLPALNISYDGRVEWNPTKSMDATIHQFRSAVLSANVRIIKQILKDLHNLAPGQIERLIALLINRTSVEPTKEALMTAICIGSRPLVEFILSLFMEYPGEERNGCRKSKSFPVHMTPLMLACICNNFAIVQCLLLRKHYMQLPHRPDCHCDECLRSAHCMENSIILLDTYRAISSESFLWLACTDPLLAAFNLAVDLQVCEEMEKEHKVAYRNLRHNVMTFAVKIAEQCWTTEEIHVLLSRKVGSPLADCELRFPRIQLALKAHMKPFLSLLGIQATIEGHWHGMWTDSGKFKCQDLSRKFRHFICYPILALLHAISAGSYIETFKYPLARYMSRLASYILFLTILIFIRYFGRTGEQSSERSLVNSNLRLILESYVYLYVYGMAVIHYIEFASKGFMTFYNVWWRWFDLILIWLFSGSFFCFIMTAATIHQDGLKQLHRRHWVYYDFSIIYDIYFGTASIMALWRLLYYFQLQRNIGSTVVSTMRKNFIKNIGITFRNLYWSFYGYLAPWDYKLVVGNAGPNQEPIEHPLTNYAGEITIAIFHIAVVITLLNLMISMLVRTADTVLKNEDQEWKFTRCQIYSEYFDWFTAIPPPFNLIYNTTCGLYRLFSNKFKFVYPDLWIPVQIWNPSVNDVIEQDFLYLKLMRLLFERYRFAEEYHYQTAMKDDADRFIYKEKHTRPLLSFMNSPPISHKMITY